MENGECNKGLNEFEKQLKEINELQKNANNPGYFVGNVHTTTPMKRLLKSPVYMIIVGIMTIIPIVYNLMNNFNFEAIISSPIGIVISVGVIVWGSIRIIKRVF